MGHPRSELPYLAETAGQKQSLVILLQKTKGARNASPNRRFLPSLGDKRKEMRDKEAGEKMKRGKWSCTKSLLKDRIPPGMPNFVLKGDWPISGPFAGCDGFRQPGFRLRLSSGQPLCLVPSAKRESGSGISPSLSFIPKADRTIIFL